MSSKAKIRDLVDAFVGDLDRLIREAVWETAQQSLGIGASPARATPARVGAGRAAKRAGRVSKAAGRPPKAAGGGRRKKGQKRNPADIARLTDRLLAAIVAKPGQRMEHLGKQIGASTAELLIPVARLVDAKKIRRTGEKRATQYFPAK
jgi:hypothetical protein